MAKWPHIPSRSLLRVVVPQASSLPELSLTSSLGGGWSSNSSGVLKFLEFAVLLYEYLLVTESQFTQHSLKLDGIGQKLFDRLALLFCIPS